MQPNDPRGLYQPGQGQPAQPVQPLTPQPPVAGIAPAVDPNALQAALDEPAQGQPAPEIPQDQSAPTEDQLSDEQYDDDPDANYDDGPVTWMALEFIHREKGTGWFVAFGLVDAALIAVSIFLMNSISFAVLLAVIFVVVIVFSRRPPRELTYSLTDEGLTIDNKLHPFATFKSFGVVHDGQEFSIMLIPTQRFQPAVTVYFPEEAGEAIVDSLGSRLPMKDLKLDAVDQVVRFLRL
jgi:hypothetical protein